MISWGDELFRCGYSTRSGVPFNERDGLPGCAADCYFAALYDQPGSLEIYRKLEAVFSDVKGAEPSRLGFLSHLSLHAPHDWRLSAELGITNLKAFRISEGLMELDHAHELARKSGHERFFVRKVKTEVIRYFELVSG